MINRLIHSTRLTRARKITDKNLLAFKIINQDPLITFAIIRGSTQEPYITIFDMEKNIVGHSCPDFNRRGEWCKHLGKHLLKLTDSQIYKISKMKNNLRVMSQDRSLKDKIQEYKARDLSNLEQEDKNEDDQNSADYSLHDLIGITAKLLNEAKPLNFLEKKIKEKLIEDLEPLDAYFTLLRLYTILSELNTKNNKSFVMTFKDTLEQYYRKAIQEVYYLFWSKSVVWRYEVAHFVKHINGIYEFGHYKDLLKIPKILDDQKLSDGYLILDYMLERVEKKAKILDRFGLSQSHPMILSRLSRHIHHINLLGTNFSEIRSWVTKKNIMYQGNISKTNYFDEFCIYLLKLLGENHQLKFHFRNQSNIFNLPGTALETNVGLKFVIDRVKESERDYITLSEYKTHKTLFQFLEGGDISTKFTEQIKHFQNDFFLPEDGLIVQWDISGSILNNNRFQAFDGSTRLVPDTSAILTSQLQPFDMTICSLNEKKLNKFSTSVVPVAILSTFQVMKYLQRGTRCVSNVLPWDQLSAFYSSGRVNSGDLNTAIQRVKTNYFIFGAQDLEKKLTSILNYGKIGISDDNYTKIQIQLKQESGYLNTNSRPLVREFMLAEGKPLSRILTYYDKSEITQMKLVLGCIRQNSSVIEFRKDLCQKFVSWIFLGSGSNMTSDLLKELSKDDLYPYDFVRSGIISKLKADYANLTKNVIDKKIKTRNQVSKFVIGRLILNELKISKQGNLQDNEIDAIEIKFKSFEKILN